MKTHATVPGVTTDLQCLVETGGKTKLCDREPPENRHPSARLMGNTNK